jgi:3-phenylpropionate/trans-cinnamate dioxygenase ferredoxin reductase subunit
MVDFVVVGASLAGAKAVETLREEGFDGRIVLIGEETEGPYERPQLSKGYLQGKDPLAFVFDPEWFAGHQVDLRLGTRVTDLDAAAHTVTLDGVEHLHYDKLLLTTGSRVRLLDVPGTDLRAVRYLRTMDESEALLHQLRDVGGAGGNVVVIGAGWIGLEVAAAARHHGATVVIVEPEPLPLRRVLGDEVAEVFAALHRANGVEFRFGASVTAFTGTSGVLSSVTLADGTQLPADLAVIGIGIRPAVELAEAAGLDIDSAHGGIVTDASLRTSDPDIYAAGDVSSSLNPLVGKHIRVEHWANALNGGKTVARAMLGQDVVYDRVPYFFSDQYDSSPGVGMEYSGWVEPGGYDQVVFRGDPVIRADASPEFIAFWVKDGRVLAGMNVNVWDVTDDIQALVRAGFAGTAVDLGRLADPKVPLGELLG